MCLIHEIIFRRISYDQTKRANSRRSISSDEISEKSHFLVNNIIEEESTMEGKVTLTTISGTQIKFVANQI